jgi:hypothetical protein
MPPKTLVIILGIVGIGTPAHALGPNGSPIDTSDYTIDLHEGPILSNSRIVGLAGAYAPLVEGVAGYVVNPASVAARVPWSKSWVDWEIDGSITLPSAITGTDFDNNGDETFANNAASFVMIGAGIQFGAWGLGFRAEGSNYDVQSRGAATAGLDMSVSLTRINVVAGYSFFDAQLMLGAGLGLDIVELEPPVIATENQPPPASVEGASLQVGAIWAPEALPLRVGAGVRVPIADEEAVPGGAAPDENGNYLAEGYYFPSRMEVPAEVHGAFALQWLRPLNVRWENPRLRPYVAPEDLEDAERQRKASQRRSKLLVAGAVKVTLPAENGVGIESFFSQNVERSGQKTTVSPRVGVESEPIPGWFVVRGGGYIEPTRFSTSRERLHGTAGIDIHIPVLWSVFGLLDEDTTFRVGGAVDGAERYFGWTVSLGIWR